MENLATHKGPGIVTAKLVLSRQKPHIYYKGSIWRVNSRPPGVGAKKWSLWSKAWAFAHQLNAQQLNRIRSEEE